MTIQIEEGKVITRDTPDRAKPVEAEAKDERDSLERIADEMDADIAAEPVDIKAIIADEAKRIVSGARRSSYGTPERNFTRIAELWTGYAKAKGWPMEFTPADVSPLMVLMKLARTVESPSHYDSMVDGVGYFLTMAEVNGVQKPAA